MKFESKLLLANFAATWFLVGLIWMVQVIHYPLFDDVGQQNYVQYQQRHQSNITLIVGPLMLLELVTAVLMIKHSPDGACPTSVYAGAGLVVLIWLSTGLIQVPCHNALSQGFDPSTHLWLVNSNWIRTIAWTLRGFLTAWMISQQLVFVEAD
ncbi:MAG: hypothetical protein AAGA30_15885 [Planctomycetota bacterium]